MDLQNFKFNKQFGQNFIFDNNLLNAIVNDSEINENDVVVEIGAGAGTLTKCIAVKAKKVIAYEIDKNLKPILEDNLKEFNNIQLIIGDIMKINNQDIVNLAGNNFKVIANLPYYITTPVIMKFLEDDNINLTSLTIMVQKEVAERIIAKPDTEEYGAITASIEARADSKITRLVNKNMFYPVPNVDSAVLNIKINKEKYGKDVDDNLFKLIRAAFAMRRKTLINNLINSFKLTRVNAEKVLIDSGFDLKIRGEICSVSDFIKIKKVLEKFL